MFLVQLSLKKKNVRNVLWRWHISQSQTCQCNCWRCLWCCFNHEKDETKTSWFQSLLWNNSGLVTMGRCIFFSSFLLTNWIGSSRFIEFRYQTKGGRCEHTILITEKKLLYKWNIHPLLPPWGPSTLNTAQRFETVWFTLSFSCPLSLCWKCDVIHHLLNSILIWWTKFSFLFYTNTSSPPCSMWCVCVIRWQWWTQFRSYHTIFKWFIRY